MLKLINSIRKLIGLNKLIVIRCAWCKSIISIEFWNCTCDYGYESHGICPKCVKAQHKKIIEYKNKINEYANKIKGVKNEL